MKLSSSIPKPGARRSILFKILPLSLPGIWNQLGIFVDNFFRDILLLYFINHQ